ncbi:uncharacterized protein FOMMEDRAFT_167251 [Fomitiporia mediterranea MF3/22]|uniref:uncharacterized protein n=1 Tax=Fomitiporia mediterranea (strain MF3/22) TaxID=694068 RepID=UPI000440827C|nr:uncharacterized protein FOMMEDRAFT_167251 [Fomitiporia mediterranea MF3/22]EJD03958.1 hypothetical protein FOMMEDRAFT_167251 [Fomitiporia mediterranea MF3/22]
MSVSVASSSICLPKPLPKSHRADACVEEVVAVEDSVQPFKQMTAKTNRSSLRLVCTVPTWSPSPMHCLDLHDLHDLRNRSIVFVHELLKLLRASGIEASYRLIPSNMDLATISISTTENSKKQPTVDHDLLAAAQSSNGKTLLARTKEGPVIIMT